MPSNANKSNLKSKEEQKMKGTFADRLEDLIKANKTTSDMVSKSTGIAKGTMSNYLNAKTSPKALELKKLADHFNVSTDFLLGRNDVKTVDIDIQAIHEKTGLSDKSIEALMHENQYNGTYILNQLLESNDFWALLSYINILKFDFINKLIFEQEQNENNEINNKLNIRVGAERIFGDPVPLLPDEFYLFQEIQIKEDFITLIRKLNEAKLRDKDLKEIRKNTIASWESIFKEYEVK